MKIVKMGGRCLVRLQKKQINLVTDLAVCLCIFIAVLTALVAYDSVFAGPTIAAGSSQVAVAAEQSGGASRTPNISDAPRNPNSALPIWALTPGGVVTQPPDDGTVLHVPGSSHGYTRSQILNPFGPPDWFPNSHPEMPKAVSEGRKPDLIACGYCHLPNGYGRPENASLAGLSAGYIKEQLENFKNGSRNNMPYMVRVAKAATAEEAEETAEYFASVKPQKWIRVVETSMVPKTHPSAWMLVVDKGGGTEPIGQRVIEVSENQELTEMRDEASGFVAYVPIGSLKRGEFLVRTGGNGKAMTCTICHGPDLKGAGNVPSIAGRSPSQMARQIFYFQDGSRSGVNAPLMKAAVSKLSTPDIVAVVGYLASLKP